MQTAITLIAFCSVFVYVESSPVIDFQFLLDPKGTQVSLQKLSKISATVTQKRTKLESELAELEALDKPSSDHLHDSFLLSTSLKSSDYKDILEKYGKMRLTKEKGSQIKDKIHLATSFLQTMDKLQNILEKGSEGYIQFSQIRNLVKTLRIISFDLFTPAEAAEDFGEICLDILLIRKPSVADMKTDYKEFCF